MTELEKAARQALEALKCARHGRLLEGKRMSDAIEVLTQALATAERKGEPIGEIVRSFGTGSGLEVRLFGGLTSDTPGIIGTKLYTSPQVPEDTALLDWIEQQCLEDLVMCLVIDAPNDGRYSVCGDNGKPGYGKTLREAIDAARKGE